MSNFYLAPWQYNGRNSFNGLPFPHSTVAYPLPQQYLAQLFIPYCLS